MTQVKFMDDIVAEYNRLFKDDETAPRLIGYVSNDMASNYYFMDAKGNTKDENGNKYYVDQFTLQEYFDNDSCEYDYKAGGDKVCKEHPELGAIHIMETCNTYEIESLEYKAHALQELAFVTCGGQL